jgi:NhaP-type Na+/H+ or K+/H+ antiporter
MNTLKKILGIVWMILAPVIICFLIYEAFVKIDLSKPAEKANTILQWVIILLIFTPISIGLFIFGHYATKDEYAVLPESSSELNDQ